MIFFQHSDTQGCRQGVIIYHVNSTSLGAVLAVEQEKSIPLSRRNSKLEMTTGFIKENNGIVCDLHVTK